MFNKYTVDSAIAQFKKVVSDLQKVDEYHAQKAVQIGNEMDRLRETRNLSIEEATRARILATEINLLLEI